HGWLAGRWRRVLRQLGLPRLLTGVCLLPLSLPATRLLLPPLRVGHLPLLLDAGYPRRKLPCSKSSSSENHRLPEAGSGFGSAGGGSAGAASGCGVTATGFGGGVGAGCGSSAGASYSSSSIWPIRAAASGRSGRLAHGFSGFFSPSEASSSFALSAPDLAVRRGRIRPFRPLGPRVLRLLLLFRGLFFLRLLRLALPGGRPLLDLLRPPSRFLLDRLGLLASLVVDPLRFSSVFGPDLRDLVERTGPWNAVVQKHHGLPLLVVQAAADPRHPERAFPDLGLEQIGRGNPVGGVGRARFVAATTTGRAGAAHHAAAHHAAASRCRLVAAATRGGAHARATGCRSFHTGGRAASGHHAAATAGLEVLRAVTDAVPAEVAAHAGRTATTDRGRS